MTGLADLLNDLYRELLFLPEQASSRAPSLDALHYFQMTLFVAVAVGVAGVVCWFAWRYRRRPGRPVGEDVTPSLRVELATYGTLLLLFVGIWGVGFSQYLDMGRAPDDALEVYVTGKQWMWKFAYPEGPASAGVLVVPAQRPVKLLITSRDVIHSFFVPAFRAKRDAVPGLYTTIWFEPVRAGRYPILCAEMCGNGHSMMRGEVIVLPPDEWAAWREGQRRVGATPVAGTDLVDRGRAAALENGCFTCHSLDGVELIGPTWEGAFGAPVRLADGRVVRFDEAYATESMMDPLAKVVAGFPDVMPSYRGLLEPAEVAAILELLKSLRAETAGAEDGP